MLAKFLLIAILSLINSDTLAINYLKPNEYLNLTVTESKDFLICIQIQKDLQKDKNFYLLFESEEESTTINKTIFYNYLDTSCETEIEKDIDLNNLSNIFENTQEQPNLENEDDGFHYEYKINKKEDNHKFALLLVTNFTGENMTLQYNSFSVDAVLIYVVVCIAGLMAVIIIAIIIVCKCYVSKKAKQMAQYGSLADEGLVASDTIVSK